jgi:flagellar basal-body rod protein FlgF
MLDGMRMATEGMMQMSMKQDMVTNNLANVGTTGFRKESLVVESFSEVLERESNGKSEVGSTGGYENHGRFNQYSQTHMSQGALKESGSAFDLALDDNGKSFFTIQTGRGIEFTRGGNFQLSTSGHLVTTDGSFVMGHRGPIQVKGGNFKVSDDGVVSVDGREIDRLLISRFEDPKAMRRQGSSAFAAETNSVVAVSDFKVKQGYTEQANFNALTEMVDLMQTMRNFEANQKALQSHDQRLQKAVNELGRVR